MCKLLKPGAVEHRSQHVAEDSSHRGHGRVKRYSLVRFFNEPSVNFGAWIP